jgi:hypothetical protein
LVTCQAGSSVERLSPTRSGVVTGW